MKLPYWYQAVVLVVDAKGVAAYLVDQLDEWRIGSLWEMASSRTGLGSSEQNWYRPMVQRLEVLRIDLRDLH